MIGWGVVKRWRRQRRIAVIPLALALSALAAPAPPATGSRSSPLAGSAATCPSGTTPAPAARTVTIGYAGISGAFPFVQDINGGMAWAAECAGVDLVTVDNGYDPDQTIEAANALIARGVDVAIEFQTDAGVSSKLCDVFEAAGIPVIAIEVPEPCAVAFGADNRAAGDIAGQHLARFATARWDGQVDALVVLKMPADGALPTGGPAVDLRADGAVEAVKAALPALPDDQIIRVDGNGTVEESRAAMADVLTRLVDANHILVFASNDAGAVVALRAVEDAGRLDQVAIAGQGATIEARDEICAGSAALIGSVAYFPERYGEQVIPLAVALAGGATPPASITTDRAWVDATNLARYYPDECPLASSP